MSRGLLSALGLLAGLALAGCGGDDEPAATQWADGVCSAITEWRTSVTETTDALRAGPTREEDLREAAEGLEEATRDLADELRGLGRPETDSGQEAEAQLDELSDTVDENLETVRGAVAGQRARDRRAVLEVGAHELDVVRGRGQRRGLVVAAAAREGHGGQHRGRGHAHAAARGRAAHAACSSSAIP